MGTTDSTAKSTFLANMSHELRTPLNSIIGMAQVLLMQSIGALNETQIEYLNDILTCGRHLLALINDVLDLSSADIHGIRLVPEPVALSNLLYECLSLTRQQFTDGQIKLEVDIDEDIPPIMLDKRRLMQVVFNLLSNALKFTLVGGTITVNLRQESNAWVRVEVVDTGIGISPENIQRLFRPFERLEAISPVSRYSAQYPGTGLGLALCKLLLELHSGQIGVVSRGIGQGSTFWFTLPMKTEK